MFLTVILYIVFVVIASLIDIIFMDSVHTSLSIYLKNMFLIAVIFLATSRLSQRKALPPRVRRKK